MSRILAGYPQATCGLHCATQDNLAGATLSAVPATFHPSHHPHYQRNLVESGAGSATSMSQHQLPWYPALQRPAYGFMSETTASSNTREMRNKAEKQRRDRLNAFIGELATLVPLVSRSTKRMDKTSILRLSATQLRLYQIQKELNQRNIQMPKHIDQIILDELVCEQLGGFLLILNPDGKIIFVSHTVENLLGHLQTDLMGQSLFSITAPDDHERLKRYLKREGELDREWRKNFSINVKRAGPRSEKSVFENVRIIGMHRHLGVKEEPHQDEMAPSTSSEDPGQVPINTDILVFFVKICRPEPLVDRLVAASKDEYVTRHLIDGRIINCDQRISLIAGYMIEEIHGKSAFMYMHRDDVRWVMIALRQMYDRGESKGNSCYRLKSRNGQFIYLRTFGYLEIDDKGVVESFVCINTLVDEKDGKALTEEMKRRYSTLINSNYMPISNGQGGHHQTPMYSDRVTFTSASSRESHPRIIEIDSTEDPVKIEQAVTQLMTGLQSDDADSPSPSPVEPYRTTSSSTNSECDISATVGKPHHLRLKTGKRSSISSSSSEPYGKRQRCTSTDSMSPQMSPEARLPRMDPTQMSPQSIASKMTPTQETRPIRRSMSSIGKQLQDDFEEHDDTI